METKSHYKNKGKNNERLCKNPRQWEDLQLHLVQLIKGISDAFRRSVGWFVTAKADFGEKGIFSFFAAELLAREAHGMDRS